VTSKKPPGKSILLMPPTQALKIIQKHRTSPAPPDGHALGLGPAAPWDTGSSYRQNGPVGRGVKPAATNDRGFITSPVDDPLALKNVSGKHHAHKTTVKVHPDGSLTVTRTPHATAASGAPSSPATDPAIAATTHGPSSVPPDLRPGQPKIPVKLNPKHPGSNPGGAIDRVPSRAGASTGAPGLTDSQLVANQLSQIYAPIIDQIKALFGQRQSDVNTYTRELADLFSGYAPATSNAYGSAIKSQAAVDAALTAALGGNAASATSDLASKLADITNPDYAGKLTGDLASNYAGAGGTMAATGGNTLGMLLADRAHASDFGAKLPGIAGLYGLQATKGVSRDLQTELGNLATQEAQQVPGLLTSLQDQRLKQAQLAFENDLAAKQYGLKVKSTNASIANAQARLQQAQANYDLRVKQFGLSEAKLREALLKDARTEQEKGKLRGLTQRTYQTYKSKALGLARIGHKPTPDGHPPVSWQTYLDAGLGKGIPIWILLEQGKRVYSQPEIQLGLIPATEG
jgi:hypothetical protein